MSAVLQNEHTDIAPVAPSALDGLLQSAITGGMTPEGLEKVFNLYERHQKTLAEQAFNKALSDFQAECPKLIKNRLVNTGKFSYKYAELDHITAALRPILQRFGFSFRFDSEMEEAFIKVTCIVAHSGGHSTSTYFKCPTGGTMAMSDMQKTASGLTYARRYALLMAFGLSTGDEDTDGRGKPGDDDAISEEQAANIQALIDEVGADKAKFLKWAGVSAIAEIKAANFKKSITALEEKRKK